MQIPTFLLRKLYIKGSLKNDGDGFTFKLKNTISSGTAIHIEPIKVNGTEYPLDATIISSSDGKVTGSEISEKKSFPIKVGLDISIHVKGATLPAGDHKIDISLTTKEVGKLAFDVTDSI
ncbi:MAG: hydroxymethylglutaryl-CoA reductase [Candidatus Thorarchaeota archaeon]|nr:MAG: hydroxymethylglutaryl-CoA reductase [Candidatus Thorarchaeota archaeon]